MKVVQAVVVEKASVEGMTARVNNKRLPPLKVMMLDLPVLELKMQLVFKRKAMKYTMCLVVSCTSMEDITSPSLKGLALKSLPTIS
jgi:hypothetical protein